MKIVDLDQRTPEWHVWRNSGVTATDARVIMGLDPEMTWWRLWRIKRGLSPAPDLSRIPHVRRGTELEPEARASFEERFELMPNARSSFEKTRGIMLIPVCAEHDEHSFIRASLDGYSEEGVLGEFKCPLLKTFQDVKEKGVESEAYQRAYPQMQVQILIAEPKQAFLSFYLDEKEQLDFPIVRDDAFLSEFVEKAKEFHRMLIHGIEPEKNPALDDFHPAGDALKVWDEKAPEILRLAKRKAELEANAKALQAMIDKAEDQLLATIPDNFMNADGAGLHITRYLQKGNVNYKKVLNEVAPDVSADILEKHRGATSMRVRLSPSDDTKLDGTAIAKEVVIIANPKQSYFF